MILEVHKLSKSYGTKDSSQIALKEVSLRLNQGEILGIVGESGSGKTTLLKLISGLEAPDAGEILLCEKHLSARRTKENLRMMQMIFQDPIASFHPRRTIEASLREAIRNLCGKDARIDLEELCKKVGLEQKLLERRPGQLSGGQCQRFAIARAIAVRPAILLCDEITSALDVSTQAQVLSLVYEICKSSGTSAIFVSHDLAVVSSLCDRIMVMKDGMVVEEGDARQIIEKPGDDYTKRLIESVMTIK